MWKHQDFHMKQSHKLLILPLWIHSSGDLWSIWIEKSASHGSNVRCSSFSVNGCLSFFYGAEQRLHNTDAVKVNRKCLSRLISSRDAKFLIIMR